MWRAGRSYGRKWAEFIGQGGVDFEGKRRMEDFEVGEARIKEVGQRERRERRAWRCWDREREGGRRTERSCRREERLAGPGVGASGSRQTNNLEICKNTSTAGEGTTHIWGGNTTGRGGQRLALRRAGTRNGRAATLTERQR